MKKILLSTIALCVMAICGIMVFYANQEKVPTNNTLAQTSLLEISTEEALLCEIPAEQYQSRYIEMTCNVCRGSGKCSRCKGKGWSHTNLYTGERVVCSTCNGSGLCYNCGGSGKVKVLR